jgi:hypothetical protein
MRGKKFSHQRLTEKGLRAEPSLYSHPESHGKPHYELLNSLSSRGYSVFERLIELRKENRRVMQVNEVI